MNFSVILTVEMLLTPIWEPEKEIKNYVRATLKEIISLSNQLSFDLGIFGAIKPKIFNDRKVRTSIDSDTLKFEYNYTIELNNLPDIPDTDLSEKSQLYIKRLVFAFKEEVYRFLILSQIAKPGTIKINKGVLKINGEYEEDFFPFVSIQREGLLSLKTNWPKLKKLSIISCWNWFNNNELSFKRFSQNKTERALNAFTYLFTDNLINIEFALFWSLMGIEALYCKGNTGMTDQIFEKTQIIFGEIKDHKKQLKAMYEFRSRLIHGDLNFPPNNYEYYFEVDEKYSSSLFDATVLSSTILVASFQQLVLKNKKEFNFIYKVLYQ